MNQSKITNRSKRMEFQREYRKLKQDFRRMSFLLMLLLSINCFSQDNESADIRDVTKLTFFNPGISYEKRIGKFQSLYMQAFMSTSFFIGFSDALGNTSWIHFDPALALQYRYYYNFANRETKGKRTTMNSLNYVGLLIQSAFSKQSIASSYYPEKDFRPINTIGLVWGIQRNYPKRFSLDLNLGPGFLYTKVTERNDQGQYVTKNTGRFTTIGDISLGFWLNKRN